MRNLFRYLNGGMIGMCGEYLYRVQYSIFPVMIVIILVIGIIIDLTDKNNENNSNW